MNRNDYFQKTPWGNKELWSLLFLVLILVPFFIEYLLKGYLENVISNQLYVGTLIGFIMSIVFMIGIYVIALKPKKLSWKEVGISRFPSSYLRPIIGWTFVLIAVSVGLVMLMELLIGVNTSNSKSQSLQSNLTILTFLIGFISAAVISPIYEELFYRGFLYRVLRSKFGVTIGMLISSTIFMLVHIPTYNTLPVNFVGGLIFSWTYEKTGSIFPAMIIHSIFNVFSHHWREFSISMHMLFQ